MSLPLTVPNSRMFLINPTLQTNMWVIANTLNEAKNQMSTPEETYAKKKRKRFNRAKGKKRNRHFLSMKMATAMAACKS